MDISQHTYELVNEKFTYSRRGKIEAKNKGEIDMYFVSSSYLNDNIQVNKQILLMLKKLLIIKEPI